MQVSIVANIFQETCIKLLNSDNCKLNFSHFDAKDCLFLGHLKGLEFWECYIILSKSKLLCQIQKSNSKIKQLFEVEYKIFLEL